MDLILEVFSVYRKSGLFFSLMIFVLPPVVMLGISSYLSILPRSIYGRISLSPLTWSISLLVPLFYLLFFHIGTASIRKWRKDPESADLDVVSKSIITLPKKVLVGALLYGLVLPQFLLIFYPKIAMDIRLDHSLLGFSATMFTGIPFYILFLRYFETWSNDVPFRKEYMSMKLSVRTNLVVLFLLASILLIMRVGIKYELKNAIFLEEVQTSLQPKLLPLELLGVFLSIFSIYLLMRGISNRVHLCQDYTKVLASGDFTGERKNCPSRDELGDLYEGLNMVLLNNAELLRELSTPVSRTIESKDAVLNVSRDTSVSIEQISRNIQNVNARMEELNENVQLTRNSTGVLNENLTHLSGSVDQQSQMVEDSSGAVTQISASIDSISSVAKDKIKSAESLIGVSDEGKKKLDITVEKIKPDK